MKKGGFFKSNWTYLLWVIVYIYLSWLLLGATQESLIVTIIAYAVSIAIALSPLGEIILRMTEGARRLKTREEIDYLQPIFEEVYQDAKEKHKNLNNKIELFITDKIYVNAFACGKKTVALTKGAINTFSKEELKGVIAHELGHIANGDTKALLLNVVGNGVFTLIILFVKLFLIVLNVIADNIRSMAVFSIFFTIFGFIFDIGLMLFMLIGQLILSINSRYNEYLADNFAYHIGYGEELISALYILQKMSIPSNISLLERLRASHPHLADRIARLEQLQDNEIIETE